MDWTSVFVEDGTEDLVLPHQMDQKATAPRLTRLVSKLYHHLEKDETVNDDSTLNVENRLLEIGEQQYCESSYSLQALYYLSINFIMGVGCLGIPYAFARAGFILCSSILLTVTLCSYMTVMWVAETGDRFEKQNRAANDSTAGPTSELSPLLRKPAPRPKSLVEESRYEVIDLVKFYLGPLQKIVYQFSLMSLMYIGLLAYSQVFCGALGALIWGATAPESAWTVIPQITFGLMVIPLSCMELDEQVAIQSIMAHVRFVAIFVMVLGSMVALSIDGSKSKFTHPPYWAPDEPDGCQMSYTACFSGFGVAFSTSLFSQLFQHSIPGLLRPLKGQPEKLPKVPVSKSERGTWFHYSVVL
jgi:amino acid permease